MGRPSFSMQKFKCGSNVISAWESHFFFSGFWLDPFYRLSRCEVEELFWFLPGPGDEVSV